MSLGEWSKSSVDYGRKLVNSGVEGALSGREAFLHGEPPEPFINASAQKALKVALLGACLGLVGGGRENRSAGRALAATFIGGAIGFGVGLLWESRRMTRCAVCGALKNIERVRDEHWLERHPIDYA